jgi:hypothetical protein
VLTRITEEDAPGGTGGELVIRGGVEVGVAQTPENAKMSVIRMNTVEEEVRCVMRDGARGTEVEEMGGGVEPFGPEGRGSLA